MQEIIYEASKGLRGMLEQIPMKDLQRPNQRYVIQYPEKGILLEARIVFDSFLCSRCYGKVEAGDGAVLTLSAAVKISGGSHAEAEISRMQFRHFIHFYHLLADF